MLEEVFSELGQRLGLGPLSFSPPKPLVLEVTDLGRISFELPEADDPFLAACIALPLDTFDQTTMAKAYRLAVPGTFQNHVLATGFQKDALLFMVKKQVSWVTAPNLEQLLDFFLKIRHRLK